MAALASLALAAALPAEPPWDPPIVIDPRPPLELPLPLVDPDSGFAFAPVLFDEAINSLELVRLDLNVYPPAVTVVPVATGSLFALGGVGRVGNQIGFSFVDDNFDLRFATCTLPCNTVSTFPVDTAQVWLDSASGASADRFFVAGLDNNPNHTVTVFTSPNGSSWPPLSTHTPPEPGGVYPNFFGGKRIGLAVDGAAMNPATTRNCLTFETRPSPGTTTNLRVLCRNGATFVFNSLVDTDVPNPQNQFDRFIEISVGMGPPPEYWAYGAYSSRTRQEMAVFVLGLSGAMVDQVDFADVPTTNAFYSFIASLRQESREVEILHPTAPNEPARVARFNPETGLFDSTRGPSLDPGPFTGFRYLPSDPVDLDDIAVFVALAKRGTNLGRGGPRVGPLGAGLVLARRRETLFDDGFESAGTSRWSAVSP